MKKAYLTSILCMVWLILLSGAGYSVTFENITAYYGFENDPGFLNDSTGNNYDLINSGVSTNANGIIGQQAFFDSGRNDQLNTSITFNGDSTATYSFWMVQTASSVLTQHLIGENSSGLAGLYCNVKVVNGDNNVSCYAGNSSDIVNITLGEISLATNHHIAVSVNGTHLIGSLDNSNNVTTPFSGALVGTGNITLGKTLYDANGFYGLIDEVMISSDPFDYDDFTALWNGSSGCNPFTGSGCDWPPVENFYLNVTIYDELTNTPTGQTAYINVISTIYSNNYTLSGGDDVIKISTRENYTIRYYNDSDIPREHYIELNDQSAHDIKLYVIGEGISSFYVPVALDENSIACENDTVTLLRLYIDNGTSNYEAVEMATTDSNGHAVLRVQPNIINYKLGFTGDCGNYVTNPMKLIDSTNSFTVTDAQAILSSTFGMTNVFHNVSFNNVTDTFVFTWLDTTNLITQGCLVIDKTRLGTREQIFSNCSSAASGSLFWTVNDTNNTIYEAVGELETNTKFSTYYSDPEVKDYRTALSVFGLNGFFIAIFFVMALVLAFSKSATMAIIALVGGITACGFMGFIYAPWQAISGIAVLGGIIIYKISF